MVYETYTTLSSSNFNLSLARKVHKASARGVPYRRDIVASVAVFGSILLELPSTIVPFPDSNEYHQEEQFLCSLFHAIC